jgi:hypothetical protein
VEDIVVPSVLDHEGVKLGDIIDIRSSMLYVIALIHKDFFFFYMVSHSACSNIFCNELLVVHLDLKSTSCFKLYLFH